MEIYNSIIERVEKLIKDRIKAEDWFHNQKVISFENKTPKELVDEGKIDIVTKHLENIENGKYSD